MGMLINGYVHMTEAMFAKVHEDYKSIRNGCPFVVQLNPVTGGTCLYPVILHKSEVTA